MPLRRRRGMPEINFYLEESLCFDVLLSAQVCVRGQHRRERPVPPWDELPRHPATGFSASHPPQGFCRSLWAFWAPARGSRAFWAVFCRQLAITWLCWVFSDPGKYAAPSVVRTFRGCPGEGFEYALFCLEKIEPCLF